MLSQCPEGQVLTGVHSEFENTYDRWFQFECTKVINVTMFDSTEVWTFRDDIEGYNEDDRVIKWTKESGFVVNGMRAEW